MKQQLLVFLKTYNCTTCVNFDADFMGCSLEELKQEYETPLYYPKDAALVCSKYTSKPYEQTHNLTFDQALEALGQGEKVARAGWETEDMYIVESAEKSSHFIKLGAKNFQKVTTDLPYLLMFTPAHKYLPGYIATKEDTLAEDWEIISTTPEEVHHQVETRSQAMA